MSDVSHILATANPKIENSRALMGDFFLSLSPAELEQLSERSLTVASLSGRSHDLARTLAEFTYLGATATVAQNVAYRLKRSKNIERQNASKAEPHTIARMLALLNERGAERFTSDPELMTRRGRIFGMNNAPASTVFRGIAYACGLRVRPNLDTKQLSLARQLVRVPADIAGIPAAVRKALPDTFLRACGISRVFESDTFFVVPNDALATKTLVAPSIPQVSDTSPDVGKDWRLQIAAAHRLKAVLGLEISRRSREANVTARLSAIPVAELDATSQSALGAIFFAEFVGRLDQKLPLKPTDYVVHFEDDLLGGRIRIDAKGQRRLDLFFLMRGPNGKGLTFNSEIGGAIAPDALPDFGGVVGDRQ